MLENGGIRKFLRHFATPNPTPQTPRNSAPVFEFDGVPAPISKRPRANPPDPNPRKGRESVPESQFFSMSLAALEINQRQPARGFGPTGMVILYFCKISECFPVLDWFGFFNNSIP